MRLILTALVLSSCLHYSFAQKVNLNYPGYLNEAVDYSVKYGIFKIGEAHLDFYLGKDCPGAYIQAYARSSGLLKLFKDVLYKYECCMDTATGLPVSDSRALIEGEYADINTVYYDHYSRKDSTLIYNIRTADTLVAPKNIYDLLSGFYNYRTKYLSFEMPVDYTVTTTTYFIDAVWDLKIRYCGKEIINTIYGPIECLKIKPLTIIGHFFRTTDAMSIWFSNDGNYVPVKFSVELKLGTLVGSISDLRIQDSKNVLE